MTHKHWRVFVIVLLSLMLSGCGDSPEIRARKDFARKANREYPIDQVVFMAKGFDKKTLEIYIVKPVAQNNADLGIARESVSGKIKEDAKALGFEEIYVKVGKPRLLSKATVEARINLR